ncbi:AaceriACL205Cp [[Ashbya] aceris (nom. inval.)]|nr:AaceriACL205Cp [[Ashbya] aceris (nom. inval.)]
MSKVFGVSGAPSYSNDDKGDSSSLSPSVPSKDNEKYVYLTSVETKKIQAVLSEEQLIYITRRMGYEHATDLDNVPTSVRYLESKLTELDVEGCCKIIDAHIKEHDMDPNLSSEDWNDLVRFSKRDFDEENPRDVFELKVVAAIFHYYSPYVEVRSVVSPVDDPNIPIETLRAYFLATFWVVIGSAFNMFFAQRQPAITLGVAAVQMLVYPCAVLWARAIPCWSFNVFGRRIALNIETPWSEKEQMFVTLLYSITNGTFYSEYNILTQTIHYKSPMSYAYQFLLSFSLQFLGFGLAGILRRYVVYPAIALWPANMTKIALNKALLSDQHSEGIGRRKMFYITSIVIFVYSWFPTYLFEALSTFNWITWIKPDSFNLATVTGGINGVGLNPISTFDWTNIGTTSLYLPFRVTLTSYLGTLLAALITLGIYYMNYQECQYLPIQTQPIYNSKGGIYQVEEILTDDIKLDEQKFQKYGFPYYTAGNIVAYGCFMCVYTALVVTSIVDQGAFYARVYKSWALDVWSLRKWSSWREAFNNDKHVLDGYHDPHSRMMRKYKEVPEWWYMTIFLVSIVIGIIVIKVFKTNTPVWGLFIAIVLNFILLLPITLLQATRGVTLGLNLLLQMISGLALPGNPYALMFIKAFGYNIDGQAENYLGNMKLAHYAKVPPVPLFRGQLLMVFIQIFVDLGVINWQLHNIENYCDPQQRYKFTCPGIRTYFNASVVWGAIGPRRIFEYVYPIMKWCWLIGACVGLFFGAWKKLSAKYERIPYPHRFSPVIFIIGMLHFGPPYSLQYFTSSLYAGFISMFYVKRYHLRIWERYNYVIAAGISCGLVFSAIVMFFTVQWKGVRLPWWGNKVSYAGLDAARVPRLYVNETERGYFGPELGHIPR